ncbi:MAG: EAL domain-containing protein, partial [Butyrivibrio sp.]|nr:EAL domain-containing protein [Butyrivibrio sp.]
SAKQILLKNMYKLILNGVHFSLDDFGTGRSNLDYFVDMPVDIIKFDYSFTHGYFKSVKAKYVMECMIELMHRMGLSIVTEGVETQDQFDAMKSLGVEYIQGYYFSKPLPKEEFLAFLREKNTDITTHPGA